MQCPETRKTYQVGTIDRLQKLHRVETFPFGLLVVLGRMPSNGGLPWAHNFKTFMMAI